MPDSTIPPKEIAARRDAAVRRALATPPKPLKDVPRKRPKNRQEDQSTADVAPEMRSLRATIDARDKRIAELERDAARYRYLRDRDLDTINVGGVFAGRVPENVVVNGEDLDAAIDAALGI